MKQTLLKKLAIAAIALSVGPVVLQAQETKDKEKTKEKKERQQIVITRSGDKEEKTIIEIDGDKVKVNGKDVADLKDVQVHINDMNIPNLRGLNPSFNLSFDDYNTARTLYRVDSNRAMLGVVTEGDDRGAAIQSITKESAADKAGLKKGDVITKIDNRKIDGTEDVSDAIRSHKPGDKVAITYLRDAKENKATAELGRWKGIDVKGMSTTPKIIDANSYKSGIQDNIYERSWSTSGQGGVFTTSSSRPKLGMSVQDTDDGKGVKVLSLQDDGTASKSGIKEGDIITHVDDKAINGADEITKTMRDKKDQPVIRLQVVRDGKSQNIEVKIPRKLKTVDM